MPKLNTGHRSLAPDKTCDGLQAGNMIVLPQAKIIDRDPAFGTNSCCFGYYNSCASHRPAAQMHQVPFVGKPVSGRILAHGRNDDTVLYFNSPDIDFTEKQTHTIYLSKTFTAGNDLPLLSLSIRI